jgi:NADH-quinone oxidoreductase subunit A
MLSDYLPILILMLFAGAFAFGSLILSHLIGPKKPGDVKGESYESGFKPFMDARIRFSVKFYIIAVLFIIFDIEVVFVYPWVVVYKELLTLGKFIFIEMLIFVVILLIGYVYLWKRGAFEWE